MCVCVCVAKSRLIIYSILGFEMIALETVGSILITLYGAILPKQSLLRKHKATLSFASNTTLWHSQSSDQATMSVGTSFPTVPQKKKFPKSAISQDPLIILCVFKGTYRSDLLVFKAVILAC